MRTFVVLAAALLALLLCASNQVFADSATWNLNPISGDWNTAANWTPNAVPTGTATFDVSNTTDISVSLTADIGSIVFNPAASAFTIRTDPAVRQNSVNFNITGLGVINNSGITQNLVSAMDAAGDGGSINFVGNATVSSSVSLTAEGNPTGDFAWGAAIAFNDSSSAGDGMYHNNGGSVAASWGGGTYFNSFSTATNATFVNDGGTAEGTGGSVTWFSGSSDAGNAVITANGGTVSGAGGAIISFQGKPSLSNATLICNGGVNGGAGGSIWFNGYGAENTNTARVELFGNATMFVEQTDIPGVDIGSLEGDGIVFLGVRRLSVGRNDLDTTFAGLIAGDSGGYNEGGALRKFGQGTLTLSGANVYAGVTTVISGALVVGNTTGSATGTGPVQVNGGTLGGKGSIDGAVTIGKGNGAGAILAPDINATTFPTLRIQSALTFKADGTYNCRVSTRKLTNDKVFANGVTIKSGAQIDFTQVGRARLPIGTVFTLIGNSSASPISGTFANLPDASTFRFGRNNYQVSYEGGDGNDLTLTVVR